MRTWPLAFFLILGLLSFGCATSDDDDGGPPGPHGDDDDVLGDDDDVVAGGLDLGGVWAQRFCQNEHYDTALGADDGTRITLARTELDQDGRLLYETSEACDVQVPQVGTVVVDFPSALIDAIPPTETVRELDVDAVGAVYENSDDPLVQLIAWHADGDAMGEPIPTDAADPRVFDMDHDGNPGATVLIEVISILEGEMYVVARTVMWVDGTVVSDEEISGTVQADSEQITIGASNAMFEQSATVTQMAGSTFAKIKIDPGTNCEAIVASADSIFGGPCPTFP
jgi:hypothetical protein